MASPFSGSSGRRASVAVANYLNDLQTTLDGRIKGGEQRSIEALTNGYKDAFQKNSEAFALYEPYRTQGIAALGQYSDAIGMNGAEGSDRATAAFRASPGYEWQVGQATDAVARKAGAIGALGSGNTMAAISDRAGHMADAEYDDYLDRLNGVVGLGYDATGRQAGITQDRGNLFVQKGRDKAGVYQHASDLGASTMQSTGMATADALQGGMMAGQNAAANRWGMGMSILNLGANLAGGGGLKNIKSLFV
ncbi:hypothetical protein [Microvirga mediterraneensis]|uniref:Uncharacterized protein n=1 Tax=Microvirga mediterraneensis TaxID=2754695 RepID=A0A838BPV1_9HYPH|nr:hypothetical protein [Microvirga mediterraneensis]MBA1156932.1 hypothetical protein [Microvirga mediterraneensis]